ncbi:MAG: hypothetical protein MJ106_00265 [Lentisphaeria bacterium]|nr:hypothetical protein [Lentisphaeria bacterium]
MAYLFSPQLITPLGETPEALFNALCDQRDGLSGPLHFQGKGRRLGVCHQIDQQEEFDERFGNAPRPTRKSRAFRLLDRLREKLPQKLPKRLYLATTVGAVDLLEDALPENACETSRALLDYAKALFGADEALLVASACASGQRAICLATDAVDRGEIADAVVVGCDQLSEFVTSGFASLGALTMDRPRPYDAQRDGMTLGEAAAALIVGAQPPEGTDFLRVASWSESTDAAHITAPALDGAWLANAIRDALHDGVVPDGIIGHGTGTIYNDQAEIAAINLALPNAAMPLFSLKGNIGHTIGATGVIQTIIAAQILKTKRFPPQIGLQTPADKCGRIVSASERLLSADAHYILTLNAGFGGLNNALLLTDLKNEEKPKTKQQNGICEIVAQACDDTAENLRAPERESLIARGVMTAEESADFRRAGLATRHAMLAAAKCAAEAGANWQSDEITVIGIEGDGCKYSNAAYWQDYVVHGRNRGRGTLFVDTLSSIPACEAAIALQLHGPAGYLYGLNRQAIRATVKTALVLEIVATANDATATLLRIK